MLRRVPEIDPQRGTAAIDGYEGDVARLIEVGEPGEAHVRGPGLAVRRRTARSRNRGELAVGEDAQHLAAVTLLGRRHERDLAVVVHLVEVEVVADGIEPGRWHAALGQHLHGVLVEGSGMRRARE